MSEEPWLRFGIFVGGRGARMGYVPKGLLRGPHGTPLIERLLKECELALPGAARVLVGDSAAYAALALPTLPDAPPGIGPLGGLRALLQQAALAGEQAVIALACDMPFVSARLLRRLALEQPAATAFAPREGAGWEPLCARYAVGAAGAVEAALEAGERSLQRVFARLGEQAAELELQPHERGELRDWDEPDDLHRDGG
ncbi:MAG TPA: NTP transferase domain-containing protein [Polyangiaceae bacterium]|nr:NTP transferase domain-containing protein [Polyangiaceae bacterium]